jgi:hypothetical protein
MLKTLNILPLFPGFLVRAVNILMSNNLDKDRLCDLVARVLGYRSGGLGSIPGTTRFSEGEKKRKIVVGQEWGPLSLVSTSEELLDRKVAAPV